MAKLLKVLHELDVLIEHRHAGARLSQRAILLLRLAQLVGKASVPRNRLLVCKGVVEIDLLARRPCCENLFPLRFKYLVGKAAILDFHGNTISFD